MTQVYPEIWNEISDSFNVKNIHLKKIMSLQDMDFLEAINDVGNLINDKLEVPNKVVLAYLTVYPLLEERESISLYIDCTNQHGLRNVLIEVLDVNEAVYIADCEYRLTERNCDLLEDLLTSKYKLLQSIWNEALLKYK